MLEVVIGEEEDEFCLGGAAGLVFVLCESEAVTEDVVDFFDMMLYDWMCAGGKEVEGGVFVWVSVAEGAGEIWGA